MKAALASQMSLQMLLLLSVLGGCAPTPWKLLQTGPKTADLMAQIVPEPRSDPLPLPPTDAPSTAQMAAGCDPARLAFPDAAPHRLPNPLLTLYVAERIVGESLVPAYRTSFHLYLPPTPWALSEEQAVRPCGRIPAAL